MSVSFMIKPEEFFREKVSEAITNQNLMISEDVEAYLVNLLIEFISPTKLESLTIPDSNTSNQNANIDINTPLAFILKAAVEAPLPQRLKIFKSLGDISLYIAGFFQDYFNRRIVDVNYYISMGSSAYENVAAIIRTQHRDRKFAETFVKMAERFNHLVEVVAEVSEVQNTDRPIDVLAVYDRWTRTNSDRLRKALNRVGIMPIPHISREKQ